jgi:hypothetical protein
VKKRTHVPPPLPSTRASLVAQRAKAQPKQSPSIQTTPDKKSANSQLKTTNEMTPRTARRHEEEQRRTHVWEPADRDPQYDYDHREAHGSEWVQRMRSFSLGHIHDFEQVLEKWQQQQQQYRMTPRSPCAGRHSVDDLGMAKSITDSYFGTDHGQESDAATEMEVASATAEAINLKELASDGDASVVAEALQKVLPVVPAAAMPVVETPADVGAKAFPAVLTAPPRLSNVVTAAMAPGRMIEAHEKHRRRRRGSHGMMLTRLFSI